MAVPRGWLRKLVIGCVGVVGLCLSAPATQLHAEPAEQQLPATAVWLRLENPSDVVADAEFVAALRAVLQRPVLLVQSSASQTRTPLLAIVYSPERGELSVSASSPGQVATTRVIEPPVDPSEVPDAAALLAANLMASWVEASAPVSKHPEPTPVTPSAPPRAAPPSVAPTPTTGPGPSRVANAGVFYPLATNYGLPELRTNFELNLLYGLIGDLDGVSLGTLSVVQHSMRGLQVATLANAVGGQAQGLQVAGGVNAASSLDVGIQVAGLGNYAAHRGRGAQLAFVGNVTAGALRGLQASLLTNYTARSMTGLQAAAGFNVAGPVRGGQIALVNRARDVDGLQVGLVNLARNVKGVQVGLVNLSHDSDGVALGLVNVSQSAGLSLSAWTSSTQHANLGLRMATPHTFTLLSLGYHHTQAADAIGAGLTLGATVPLAKRLSLDVDVGGDYLIGTRLCCYESRAQERTQHGRDRSHFRLRFVPTWRLHPAFAVFGGAGLAARIPFALYSNFREGDRSVRLVPELLAGVSI